MGQLDTSMEAIRGMIYIIRGQKVILAPDLASLYGVKTKRLNEQVKRNIQRFPEDFMFLLTKAELENLRSQIATSSWGGERYIPYAFTEQGVAMLSSVLNSDRAIQVNIAIMRTFTKLREMMTTHKDLREKIEALEKKNDKQFQIVFTALKELLEKPKGPEGDKLPIGFCAMVSK
ncbi:MAG: ORF6N domain-containing protein [Candidatus Omnitrophica bacterium]|nr:ORF6N domain-containing protein [Candidatus Omnitrophota bacterium]